MPPVEDIQRNLTGAWRLMTGKRDGIRLMDVSADGFWNSFFAIVIAAPVMLLGWIPVSDVLTASDPTMGSRLGVLLRLAIVDVGAWVLPIAGLAAIVSRVGLADRFSHYVVASNWGSALLTWFMLPTTLLRVFVPAAEDLAMSLSLGIFLVTLVLSWRLTNAVFDRGAGTATGVFAGMLLASILTLFAMQDMLGVGPVQ